MLRTLDLFLLTLVRDGINTPYDWQRRAGVSLGASLPAVKRLLNERMVSEGKKGSRGRREFSITRTGRTELLKIDLNLEEALEEGPGDLNRFCGWLASRYRKPKLDRPRNCYCRRPRSMLSDLGGRRDERVRCRKDRR